MNMENEAVVVLTWECHMGRYWLPCGCDSHVYTNHMIEEEDFYGDHSYEYSECNDCGAVFYVLGGDASVE